MSNRTKVIWFVVLMTLATVFTALVMLNAGHRAGMF